jgi:hypothetical protein
MKKSALLLLVSMAIVSASVSASMPAFAQAAKPAAASSDNKVVAGFKKVGRGIMWGPKKMWSGMQTMGKKMTGKS